MLLSFSRQNLGFILFIAAKVKSEDGEQDRRILARSKSNIGPDDGGFEYHLEQTEVLPGIQASYVTWGNSVDGSARELLSDPNEDGQGDHEEAAEMLKAELTSDCWTNVEMASKPLKAAGFSKKQIWSASKKLKVIRKKGGMNGGGTCAYPVV